MARSCLGLVSAFLVMSRCCFGDVSVMSPSCLGRLSVVSRSYLRDVSVLVLCCLVDVSGFHGDVSVLS